MQSRVVLAIDLGTSGPKVALVSELGEILGHEFEPTRLTLSAGGGATQDPAEWWDAIGRASRRLLGRQLVAPGRIEAVSVTAQWSGTVVVDAKGRTLGDAIIWMDSRGAARVRELTRGFPMVEGYGLPKLVRWIRLTGGVPGHSGKDSIAHILYIQAHEPERYAKAHKFLEPKDWINFALTGRMAATYDSITLHWVTDNRNPAKVDYHAGLLAALGVEREKLPDLCAATDILGTLHGDAAAHLGVEAGIRVLGGTPDLHSAAIGSGAVRDFEGHLYVGTSSWLTCHVPFKRSDLFANMASIPAAIPGRYLVANEQETAGACLNFLRDKILFADDALGTGTAPPDLYRRFDSLAERATPGCRGLMFLPWLYGERTPVEDHRLRGGFFNLGLDVRREELVRSVFEGVALNARWLLGAVERFCRRPFPSLNIIGGGAKSAVWCQIFADVLDRPIRQMKDPVEANNRGAAFLAAVGMGWTSFEAIAEVAEVSRTFEPRPENRAVHAEQFDEFLDFHRRNKKANARINRDRGESQSTPALQADPNEPPSEIP